MEMARYHNRTRQLSDDLVMNGDPALHFDQHMKYKS